MSRLLTRILLPGEPHGHGLMDWGELTAEEMIGQYRRHAAYLRKQVEAIEAAADSDFKIDVVRGSQVEHHVRSIQPGRSA
jgi:hypothetical protein